MEERERRIERETSKERMIKREKDRLTDRERVMFLCRKWDEVISGPKLIRQR